MEQAQFNQFQGEQLHGSAALAPPPISLEDFAGIAVGMHRRSVADAVASAESVS